MKQPGRKPFPHPQDLAGVLAWHKRQVETARARAARYLLPEPADKRCMGAAWRAHQAQIAMSLERLHGACVDVIERELADRMRRG